MFGNFIAALSASSPIPFLPEIVAFLAASAIIAYLCQRLGLVPIVGFLLTGVVIGPNALGLVQNQELINVIADIGVVLLLFTIGIEFSLEKLARIKEFIFVGGALQTGLVIALTAGLLFAFGIDWRVGIFTGCLVVLSSTVIVLKLLGDRSETNSPGGQISMGVLIFQDLAVIIMVLLVPMLAGQGGSAWDVVWALAKALGIIALVLVVARRLMPPVLEIVARTCSNEIFLLTVIAICFGTAWLTSLAGLSLSLGAFLAGLIVSESEFSEHALGEILPLQILFSAAFFVSVGMLLDLRFLVEQPLLVLGTIAGVIVIKLLATSAIVLLLGYPLRIALLASFLLIQIGEFAFVLEREGRALGLYPLGLSEIGGQTFIAASVILIVFTPFLAQVGYAVEARLVRYDIDQSRRAAEAQPDPEPEKFANLENHVIVAGYGAGGRQLVRVLRGSRIPYVITTLSPAGATEAESEGLPVLRGDGSRLHTLSLVGVQRAKLLVVADDDPATARRITAVARFANPTLAIIVRTRYIAEVGPLTAAGADIVIPEELESTVQLFVQVLEAYRIAPEETEEHIHALRANGYAALREDRATQPPVVCEGLDEDCIQTRMVTIRAGAQAVEQPFEPLALQRTYGLRVQAVQRAGRAMIDLPDQFRLQPGDRLVLVGRSDQFAQSAEFFRAGPHPDGEVLLAPAAPAIKGKCMHREYIHDVTPSAQGCEECLAMGEKWVHLRICLTCGHVGCCDSSRHKHATQHFQQTGHPIIQSFEPGEDWRWCYIDRMEV